MTTSNRTILSGGLVGLASLLAAFAAGCGAGVGDELGACEIDCTEEGDTAPEGTETFAAGANVANFQNGVSPSASYAGVADTFIQQSTPTTTAGSDPNLKADFDYPTNTRKNVESLLRFDLSSIPTNGTVTSAKLVINVTNPTTGTTGYSLYPMARSWSESQATWNSPQSGAAWGTPGARGAADRSSGPIGTLIPTARGKMTLTLNAAGIAAVQAWVKNPSANFGFVIDTPSNMDGLWFDSSNASVASNRPQLSVGFTLPTPPPPADAGTTPVDSGTTPIDSGVITPPPSNGFGAGSAPIGTPCPAGAATTVNPSMSTSAIQSAINAQAVGATICFAPGVYRLTATLSPKTGQRLHGEAGAILNGAALLASWAADGTAYRASNVALSTSGPMTSYGQWCEDTVAMPCAYAEDVFFDGQPLVRAATRDAVVAGTFFTDYSTRSVYIGSNPAGHRVEIGTTSAAIRVGVNDVTIEGLTVEMFAQYPDRGAIEANPGTSNTVIQNCESRFNHGAGIFSVGAKTKLLYNRLHDNGQLGASLSRNDGAIIDHNDFIHNNIAGFWRIDGAAGGIKFCLETNTTVSNNVFRDNQQHGIWYDQGANHALIVGNLIDHNFASGLLFEVSRYAQIVNNVVTNNGLGDSQSRGHIGCQSLGCSGGIQVSNSAFVEIAGNTLTGNIQGMSLTMTARTPFTTGYDIPNLTDINVHDNDVNLGTGMTGVVFNSGPAGFDPYAASSNNHFTHNTYHLATPSSPGFYWNKARGDSARWKGFGHDTTGTFLSP